MMKRTAITLLILALASVVIAEVTKPASPVSPADILVARVTESYAKAVSDADAAYAKSVAPLLKRYDEFRDKKILIAGNSAIKRFSAARKGASELDGIRMEQEIEKIRVSLNEKVGSAPKVQKVSVLEACGTEFQGHTYLAIVAKGISWNDAKEKCEKMGGHLIYVETAEEMLFIEKLSNQPWLWAGATDEHKEGEWRWLNGKAVAKNLLPKRTSTTGNRNNFSRYRLGRLWDAPPNMAISGFICEWE